MRLPSRIVWADGMHLAPHHFQAQNRYFEGSVHFATASLWENAYGFSACQLDVDALRNGTVALVTARGMFEDGLAFEIPGCDSAPESFDVAAAFPPTADHLTVYLAVPRWLPDGQNCGLETDGTLTLRYTGVIEILHDENTGRDEKPICLAHKNIRLISEFGALEDLLTLPIARVGRDGSGHFIFDPAFVPPSMRFSASECLTSMLQRLVEILEDKAAVVSQNQQQSAGKFHAGMSVRHVSQFWFLHAINSSLTPLRHLLLSKHGHPEELFLEMSRLAGALCTFGLDTHPRSLPQFDHRDPGPAFAALDLHIRQHLEIAAPSQAVVIPLDSVDRYFYQAEVKDQRCFDRSRWILGIHSPAVESELIAKVPQLVKICSTKFVPELVKRALPGLSMTHLAVAPSAISAKVESQYFAISRTGPCWEHIMQTRTVGVYVPGELQVPEMELVIILDR